MTDKQFLSNMLKLATERVRECEVAYVVVKEYRHLSRIDVEWYEGMIALNKKLASVAENELYIMKNRRKK